MVGFFNLVYDADMPPKDLQPEEEQATNDKLRSRANEFLTSICDYRTT